MCRLSADGTSIAASLKNINVAKIHSKKSNLEINYLNNSPEQMTEKEKYDVILNLEIVEHVDDINLYFKSCTKLCKFPKFQRCDKICRISIEKRPSK